jgi:hypothetical protein
MHTYAHTHTHMYIHTYTNVNMFIETYLHAMHLNTPTHTHMRTNMYEKYVHAHDVHENMYVQWQNESYQTAEHEKYGSA